MGVSGAGAIILENRVVEQMSWNLLKVQADVMAAQAKAVAVQIFLPCRATQGRMEIPLTMGLIGGWEGATFANWSKEDQLYQLKLHLDKTALNVFRMLNEAVQFRH
jgi:hypothetical protein